MNLGPIFRLLTALILIGGSIPLVRRRVRPNHWYGIRIREAFKSEARWFEINEYGGRLFLRFGFLVALAAIAGLFLPKPYWLAFNVGSAVFIVGGLVVIFVMIFRYAAKTKKP